MNLPEIVEQALKLSQADDCIVIARDDSRANIRWAANTSTTNGSSHEFYLSVISLKNGKAGVAASTLSSTTEVGQLIKASEAALRYTTKSQDYQPLLRATGRFATLKAESNFSTQQIAKLERPLAAAFAKANKQHVRLFGYAESTNAIYYLGTSTGIRKSGHQLNGHIGFTAKSPDFKKSVWSGQAAKNFDAIDVGAHYAQLKTRLDWSQKQLSLPAGKYETILSPSAMGDLMIYFYDSLAAREADEGRSPFSKPGGNRLGESFGNLPLDLYSDPKEPGLEALPFVLAESSGSDISIFDNGLPIPKTYWLKQGQLKNLIAPRYWAQKQGYTKPTPFAYNLIMDAAGPTEAEMIKHTKRGLYVNCLWYIRVVNPQTLLLTGLTRDGVYLIENGRIVGAVNNFRFNMSPLDVLRQATEAGRAVPALAREFGDEFNWTKMPPLRVNDFNMSSVSQAI